MINLTHATEALAHRLAEAQHLPVEDAIRQALESRAREAGIPLEAARFPGVTADTIAKRRARFDEISEKIAAMTILDPRSPEEIMDDLNEL